MIRCTAALILLLVVQTLSAEPNNTAGAEKPFLLQFTDDPSRAMLLEPLRSSTIGESQKEVRIWIGFGLAMREKMVRFRIAENGEILGDTFLFYPAKLKNDQNPDVAKFYFCLLYTSPSPRDGLLSRMPSSA